MSKTANHMYDLSGVLPVEALSDVRAGSTLLISGPALSGKDEFALDVLGDGVRDGQGAIAVTTGGDGTDWITDIDARAGSVPGYSVAAIDCRSERGRSEEELDNEAFHYSVAEPSDLTGIGIGITKCFSRLQNAGITETRLALTSLSTMLTYSDRKTTFEFCHVLSSRLDSAGFLGVFTIDSSAHDEQTMQVIKQAFDGQIELRNTDGATEARFRGLDTGTTGWLSL